MKIVMFYTLEEATDFMKEFEENGRPYSMEYHPEPYMSWRTEYETWKGYVFLLEE